MKKAFFLVCTVLCANLLVSQTFTSEGLNYEVIDDNSVRLADNNEASGEIVIPSAVIYDGNTYSVTAIGFAAFLGSGLTSVTLPNSVTEIGDNAFYDCRDLASVSLGGGITYIGENGFGACGALTSIVLPNNLTRMGASAFENCIGLTSINIPDSIASIENSTFNGCNALTSISIPDKVVSIGDYAFDDCSALTSVTIGKSVTSIGDGAFGHSNGLTTVVSLATIPPQMGSGSFPFPNSCTVTVPCGSLEAYTSDGLWGQYFIGVIREDCASLETVSTTELSVCPNPAKSFVNLEFEALKENTLLQILDLNGRILKAFDLKAGQETLQINVGELPKAAYTIILGNTTKKLIVE